jgi:hypothetical protein
LSLNSSMKLACLMGVMRKAPSAVSMLSAERDQSARAKPKTRIGSRENIFDMAILLCEILTPGPKDVQRLEELDNMGVKMPVGPRCALDNVLQF